MKSAYAIGITDVARAAGVSPATVSRAMNHPALLNPATRRRVEEAIRATGYVRNRAAQMMHGRRSNTIGLVVPTVNYSIFAELVQCFSETVSDLGFTLLLATYGYDLEEEYRVLRKLLEHRVDGVALVGLDHTEDTFDLLEAQDVPALAVWSHSPTSRMSCIGADNRAAGRLAAQHLLALGHRRIGLVFPPVDDNDRARDRLGGVAEAMAEAGIAPSPMDRVEARYSIAQGKLMCLELLERRTDLTALVCGNDIIAHGALAAAAHLGARVPTDLSIVGIGDFPGSGDIVPALTTIRLPARLIGQVAGRHLEEMISDPALRTRTTRDMLQIELVVRGTTRRVSASCPSRTAAEGLRGERRCGADGDAGCTREEDVSPGIDARHRAWPSRSNA